MAGKTFPFKGAVFDLDGTLLDTLADIANAANVTRGAIYHHFGNKPKLYEALINEAAQLGGGVIQDAIAKATSFVETCERILIGSWSLLERNEQMRQITELSLFKTGVDPELIEMEQLRQEQAVQMVNGIAQFMEQGINNGDLHSDLNPVDVARSFIAFQNGIIHLWLSNPNAFSIHDAAPKFANIFLEGVKAR